MYNIRDSVEVIFETHNIHTNTCIVCTCNVYVT